MPTWSTIALRALGALVMLFVMTRILGKKQISQLTFFEYITGITLGELAGFMSTDMEGNYVHGIIAISIWFLVPLLIELVTLKSRTLRHWFEGKGTVLIKEGKVLEDNLKKERYTGDELLEQLRTKGVFKVTDVEFAMLEASGDVSILLKKENQPLTPKHLGIKIAPEQETQTVIMDGAILEEPLSTIGQNKGWLHTELNKIGIPLENVFLGQVDTFGELTVDLYDDQLKVPQPTTKAALLATLKKCAADLEMFGIDTEQQQVKAMYEGCAGQLERVVSDVTPLLKR